jgi:serine protease Do
VRPAIVYLTETFTGYVADETGTYFNDGNPYELSVTCTGFGVNPDGYIATAGHCVDTASPDGIKAEFITAAARQVIAAIPGVTLPEAVQFGTANWSVEGAAKGSPIDSRISVITGSTTGAATGKAMPARVVDFRPLSEGDVALLKVESADLPSVELGGDADVQIGTPLLSVGYPASADAVTDPSLEPSNKDGQVSSKKTVGSVPVYETSAALTPGMSGGPTVDLEGRVLGINSFMPAGESQAFNFIAPSTGLSELLSRNGVRNELGPDDRTYRTALDDYYAGHYTAAIAGFDKLLQVSPQHAQATQFRTAAAKAKERFGDTPVAPAPEPPSGLPFGLSPVLFWSIVGGGAAVLAGLVVLLVVRRGRRQGGAPAATAQPMPYPPVPSQWGPPQGNPPRFPQPFPQPTGGPQQYGPAPDARHEAPQYTAAAGAQPTVQDVMAVQQPAPRMAQPQQAPPQMAQPRMVQQPELPQQRAGRDDVAEAGGGPAWLGAAAPQPTEVPGEADRTADAETPEPAQVNGRASVPTVVIPRPAQPGCTRCGAAMEPSARFCAACGQARS